MGLFDTVSSYGKYFSNDVDDLQLKIPDGKYPKVDKVVHLVAADEYRALFALTDIPLLVHVVQKSSYLVHIVM